MPKIVDIEENRKMIAQAACRAIAEKGIVGVRLTDIARAAGVTTGMIANYFRNKDEIIAAALRVPFENVNARINARIAEGEDDLADILDAAIPATPAHAADTAAWVSFWGLIATDTRFRALNAELHAEGARTYAAAIRAAWPEASAWPEPVFEHVLRSVATFLFGLSAGGVTSPAIWTPDVQRAQLRSHLSWLRDRAASAG